MSIALSRRDTARVVRSKLGTYAQLIKSLQTGLLLMTALTGYLSARCPIASIDTFVGLMGSMVLAISGSTILNMVYDRDIDALMWRTARRPLPSGQMDVREALVLGLTCSFVGVAWAFQLSVPYGAIVLGGLFIDVVVYTMWLKRRTPWSIIWGGISGGMPILAGRVLAIGAIDATGVLFAVTILLWIPTHILTFSIRHAADYQRAGIPTFVATGVTRVRVLVAASSVAAAIAMAGCLVALGVSWGYLRVLALLTLGIVALAVKSILFPTDRTDLSLFKGASLYMLGAMLTATLGSLH